MYYSTEYVSPIGRMLIVSDGDAICGVWFYGQKHFLSSIDDEIVIKDDLTIFRKVKIWLDDYFRGLNPEINFKLKPAGTDFRLKVWEILSQIPYGQTTTYGEIALRLSDSMSAQAVGSAVGHNPISVIIPCHRIIGADRKLGGYAGGIDKKIALLRLEKIDIGR